jgi:sugar O-acyltransferase (sialic acid O-acetyltransferase NeuD family)
MKNIILIGAGGHANSCIDVIEQEKKFKILLLVGKKQLKYKPIKEIKYLSYENFKLKENFYKKKNILIAFGNLKLGNLREKAFNYYKKKNFIFPKIISPYAYVSNRSILDEGTIVMHKVIINAGAKIGKNCIINTASIIEHDVIIEDNVHIAPGAIILGGCIIKKNSFVGANATIKQNTMIRENSIVKANKYKK